MTENRTRVSLTVDYGDGSKKVFANIGLGVILGETPAVSDVLAAAAGVGPGLDYELAEGSADRGGRTVTSISSIDGVSAAEGAEGWAVFVNRGFRGGELRVVDEGSVTKRGEPAVADGDAVSLRLTDLGQG